jgi:cytochrome P450
VGSDDARDKMYSWLLFSAGPRNCIGQKFADMQVKVILAMLLQKFRFTIPEGAPEPKLIPTVITKSMNGINLIATPR